MFPAQLVTTNHLYLDEPEDESEDEPEVMTSEDYMFFYADPEERAKYYAGGEADAKQTYVEMK